MFRVLSGGSAGRVLSCVAGAAAGLVLAATAQAATTNFDGQVIRVTDEIGGFPITTADVTVGPGVELANFGFLDFDIDIGATTIDLLANSTIPVGGGIFGLGFSDVNAMVSSIVSVMIGSQSGFSGFTAANLGIVDSGNKIVIDFGGVDIVAGDVLLLDVTFKEASGGVIPLPATLPLLLGGFAALAAFRRSRATA